MSDHVYGEGASRVAASLGYALSGRARVVVIENVDEPDGVDAINSIIATCAAYWWRSQSLDSHVHAGQPVARRRRFWVGVRRPL